MHITDLIDRYLRESDAADQAKKMKLTSAGWGKWKNAQGEVTHKTVGGKLVKIEKNDKSNKKIQQYLSNYKKTSAEYYNAKYDWEHYDDDDAKTTMDELEIDLEEIYNVLKKYGIEPDDYEYDYKNKKFIKK